MKWSDIDITSPDAVLGSVGLILAVLGMLTASFALELIGIVLGAVLVGMTLIKRATAPVDPAPPQGIPRGGFPAPGSNEVSPADDVPATPRSLGTVHKRSP